VSVWCGVVVWCGVMCV